MWILQCLVQGTWAPGEGAELTRVLCRETGVFGCVERAEEQPPGPCAKSLSCTAEAIFLELGLPFFIQNLLRPV